MQQSPGGCFHSGARQGSESESTFCVDGVGHIVSAMMMLGVRLLTVVKGRSNQEVQAGCVAWNWSYKHELMALDTDMHKSRKADSHTTVHASLVCLLRELESKALCY